jgi:transposase
VTSDLTTLIEFFSQVRHSSIDHEESKIVCSEALNDEGAGLLMTIPGISFYSALLLVSEIGDVDRFPDSAHLVSYAGLASSTHSSGGATYRGRISKAGSPYLR